MRGVLSFFLFLAIAAPASGQSRQQIDNLDGLVERTVPDLVGRVRFVIKECGESEDYFHIESESIGVKITANRAISASWGLNWFLKYGLNSSLSWCGDALSIPETLPKIDTMLTTSLRQQFNYNYCTFGYTMPFWEWEQWEREIDLMALSGVTTPLAMVGAELVWINTLKRFGYSQDEALEFITGPAFLPWFLMGNMERDAGPLPQEWLSKQYVLQCKILERMRLYGMEPVLQGFYGMVPQSLKGRFPESLMLDQGSWNVMTRPLLLAPTDTLFDRMADVWYEESERLFGEANFYAGDLFHEGGHSGELVVSECAAKVQDAMQRGAPGAKWVIQSWGGNPTSALLKGLEPKYTVIVDICAEYWDRWHERNGFDGFPWVWGHITNWGGNIGSHGRLSSIATEPIRAQRDLKASHSMVGTGAFAEGTEVNTVVFDLASEMRWHACDIDIEQWVDSYARRRYNTCSSEIRDSWQIFLKTIYGSWELGRRPSESVFCAPPSLKGESITASAWSQCRTYYDTELFAKGVESFLKEADKFSDSESYQYDVVDFVRQYIADLGREAYYRFVESYQEGDMESFNRWSGRFLELLEAQDELLSTHPMFYVARWLDLARGYSDSGDFSDLYEYNARLLIGTWSREYSSVRDYGHREWGGLLKDYYLPRWSLFVEHLSHSKLQSKQQSSLSSQGEEGTIHSSGIDRGLSEVDKQLLEMEQRWCSAHNRYIFTEGQDPVAKAKDVFFRFRSQSYN